MTLKELDKAKALSECRRLLLHKAGMLDAERPAASMLLGYTFDADVCDVLRRTLAGEFRRLAGVAETRLRELGVVFPGDAVPGVEADKEPDPVWPAGCRKRGTCTRHEACMYTNCVHGGTDIRAAVHAAHAS